jgi:glycosyltransferase involved in cell wall biosynthesis
MSADGMDDSPIVSVVIPCYGQAHYLAQAIESVLDQTYPWFEIVVVDDGSPDDTQAVAGRYPRARYLRQRNRGQSAARNTGLHESAGTYVVFLDADDRLMPEALAIGAREMAAHPDCMLVAGDHQLIDEQGSILPSYARERITQDHYRELLMNNFIWCPASAMYRRSVFGDVGGFDTSLRSAEDYELYLRIARRFRISTHREVVSEYRVHRSGLSRNSGRMLRCSVNVLRGQKKYFKGDRVLEESCDKGIQAYQRLYGVPLIRQIAAELRQHRWRGVVSGSFVAARYYPRVFATHAYQRVCRTIAGVFN